MSLICIRGHVFGRLTVISRHGSDSTGKTTWLCACECGAETVVTGLNLKSGNTKSCGCAKNTPRTRHDISGMRFGYLTVIKRSGSHGGRSQWECMCDCGEINYVTYSNLVRGVTRSCGCLQKQNVRSQWEGHVPTTKGTWARHTTNEGICAKCGTTENLHAHHMFPVSTHPDMMLDATNGIALCGPCHRAYHSAHKLSDVSPASLCAWIGMDGLISQFFEYFVGYKDKGGIEDLRKAAHCVELLIQFEMDEAHKRAVGGASAKQPYHDIALHGHELYSEEDEKRMDVVGQNGPTAEHYMGGHPLE